MDQVTIVVRQQPSTLSPGQSSGKARVIFPHESERIAIEAVAHCIGKIAVDGGIWSIVVFDEPCVRKVFDVRFFQPVAEIDEQVVCYHCSGRADFGDGEISGVPSNASVLHVEVEKDRPIESPYRDFKIENFYRVLLQVARRKFEPQSILEFLTTIAKN